MIELRYGTRGSKLALHQTRQVIEIARNCSRNSVKFSEIIIKTLGDQVTGLPLFKVGGQGLFIKEIEQALLEKRIDVAVHSLKDVPHAISEGLSILAVGCPTDPRDCFISKKHPSFARLPPGAVVGTSSLRRRSQLSCMRQDLEFSDFRGNLDTRLQKLEDGEVDAIILATAGLERFGWQNRLCHHFSIEEMTPPAGQGLLAVQCRTEDVRQFAEIFADFADRQSELRARAERAFLARLQGGCQTPMAVHAIIQDQQISLHSFVGSPDGSRILRRCDHGQTDQAEKIGKMAAEAMLSAGAASLLANKNSGQQEKE
jgi:hydroxymethylbilane synthase